MAFSVHLITPERALPPLDADHVTVVAVDGQLGIRTGHAPLVALIKPLSYLIVRQTSTDRYRAFALRGGVVQMLDNQLKVLSPEVADVHALDATAVRARAQAAQEPTAKAWFEHQLATAEAFPPVPGRV